jgi:hypothetical protein
MRNPTILVIALLASGVAAAKDDRVIEGSQPVAGANRLALDANVGSLTVKVGAGDKVSWRVALEADPDGGWFSSSHRTRDVREAIDAAKVEATVRGETLEIVLVLPRGTDDDDVNERWTVEVPDKFAARVALDVGELRVSGISGGVRASVDVGDIELELPGGAIEASVDVGSIDIVSATAPSGDIDLEADVGDVDLELDGRHIRNDHGYGPGASLRLSGKGGDRVRARVDVGDIDAHIGKR